MQLRIELGPCELENDQSATVRRDTGDKKTSKLDGVAESVKQLLDSIQMSMFAKLVANLFSSISLECQ